MRIGVLVNEGEAPVKNIGDYIQSLVQTKFWNRFDCFIERENLSEYQSEEKIKVIMNGWFMRHPDKFPPAECIIPLFTSFHVTPRIESEFFSEKTIEYLKKYQPIGCRDYDTVKMMESHGIKAYFTGCLTLCLGEWYHSVKSNRVYFVDPYYDYSPGAKGWKKHLKALYLIIKHHKKISTFIDRFEPEFYGIFQKVSPKLNKWAMAASFYETYRSFFGDEIFVNAEFINHQISQKDYPSHQDKIELAHQLMKKYSQAGMVVTSRIHCALPCLGVETPLFFVTAEEIENGCFRSGGRLTGLIELFNVLRLSSNGLISASKNLNGINRIDKIAEAKAIGNPSIYKILKKDLMSQIQQFIN